MVAETLSSSTPQLDNHSGPGVKTQPSTVHQATAKKSASSNNADRSGSRQERLVSHLLIGFLMVVIALAGYLFLVPHAQASDADRAGNHIVNVATNVPPYTSNMPIVYDQNQMSDLIAMQAKMAEITNQLNALKAENTPMNMASNATGSTTYNTMSGYNQDQMLTKLDQMMSIMDDIMSKMNGSNTQTNGMNNPASGTEHGHH